MDILTLKSKVKLGCNMCDKCCIYRGDIRLLPINVCRISEYLNISIKEFLEKYTDRLEKLGYGYTLYDYNSKNKKVESKYEYDDESIQPSVQYDEAKFPF